MALSNKKVIVRLLSGEHRTGYLPASSFLRLAPSSATATLDLLDLAGRTFPIPADELKYIAFVRDFNLDDPQNPERLTRRAFLSRPRSAGLWMRITFSAGDHLEGLAPLDTSFLDALLIDAGIFLTPPDDRTNTHRIYVPRVSIDRLQILAVVTTPSRSRPVAVPDTQTNLFPLT